jgi:hypothetical protein
MDGWRFGPLILLMLIGTLALLAIPHTYKLLWP